MKKKRFTAILMLLLAETALIYPQTKLPFTIEAKESSRCEWVSAILSSFIVENENKSFIIIISHSGSKETKNGIAKKRLDVARKQFVKEIRGTNFYEKPENVITAVSTEKTKEAKLDFYVDGEVKFRIFFRNNLNLCLSPEYP